MPEPGQKTRRWAIDTSIVLGALRHKHGACTQLLATIDSTPGIQVVASTLLIAECIDIHRDPEARKQLEALLASPTIAWVPVSRALAIRARQLGRDYAPLKGADAVHLACAIVARAEVLFAKDGDFAKVFGQSIDGTMVLPPDQLPGQQILQH